MATTQYVKHVRPDNSYAPDLRGWQPTQVHGRRLRFHTHHVDVRRILGQRGRYNIQNVGVFLWSLNAYG